MEYTIFNVTLPLIGVYILTYTLYRNGRLRRSFHVNLWNLIILIAFLISGIGGFILLFLLENGIRFSLNSQLLYWHVEAGLALVLVTIFHFHCYRGSLNRILGVGR